MGPTEPGAWNTAAPPHPWDGFLAGPENALAQAGVLALARGDAGLSPLVLHGPAGSGKSRLLAGLVAEWIGRRPGAAVAHLTAEAFAQRCSEAADRGPSGGWAELRERFRRLDLLVLEDLHAMERAPLAREELGHTLDALAEAGAAVAASARVGPGQWPGDWPARLISRLSAGLAVRVEPPGPESRRRYVLERARARGLRLPAEAVDALAEAADGYRTLDGWLARLELDAALGGGAPAEVGPIVAEGADDDARRRVDRVVRDVAARFGVRPRDLRSPARHAALMVPRHLAILLAREATGASFAALGRQFGRRDAATIRHACRAAARRLEADPALAAVAAALRAGWRPPPA